MSLVNLFEIVLLIAFVELAIRFFRKSQLGWTVLEHAAGRGCVQFPLSRGNVSVLLEVGNYAYRFTGGARESAVPARAAKRDGR